MKNNLEERRANAALLQANLKSLADQKAAKAKAEAEEEITIRIPKDQDLVWTEQGFVSRADREALLQSESLARKAAKHLRNAILQDQRRDREANLAAHNESRVLAAKRHEERRLRLLGLKKKLMSVGRRERYRLLHSLGFTSEAKELLKLRITWLEDVKEAARGLQIVGVADTTDIIELFKMDYTHDHTAQGEPVWVSCSDGKRRLSQAIIEKLDDKYHY